MNIELQVKMLYANADKLDEAGFVADFYYIAKEYARQQLLEQTPCTTLLPLVEQSLLDEAVSDVINISKLNPAIIAKRLIKEQFYVAAKEDLPAAIA